MLRKYCLKESGFTLIEVLTVLLISAFTLSLIFGVLTSTVKYNNKTQSHINLRQDANLIISQVRQLHQGEDYKICDTNLIDNSQIHFKEFELQNNGQQIVSPDDCKNINTLTELIVQFTLTDNEHNEFEIKTVIEARKANKSSLAIKIEKPGIEYEQDPYQFIRDNQVFVYSSNLGISGSTTINGNGTIILINNGSDLTFPGDNRVSVKFINIDKSGKKIILSSSTHLGKKDFTETIYIKGELNLNNGGAKIYGNTIYINGDVKFNDSAIMEGKKVYINGNVEFKNSAANIIASEIYVTGNIKKIANSSHSSLKTIQVETITMPERPIPKTFNLREDNWYSNRGYKDKNTKLSNGVKIFADTYKSHVPVSGGADGFKDVTIVSKGDITLTGEDWNSYITGVLIAPNGKVDFHPRQFTGVVISKDGFYMNNGNAIATYNKIEDYFIKSADFPLQ